jgi:hypothetical protein
MDVFITTEQGSGSRACVPLENRETFQKIGRISFRYQPFRSKEISWSLEPRASIRRQSWMQVRLGGLRADNGQPDGTRP